MQFSAQAANSTCCCPQVTQDVPPLPRYTVSIREQSSSGTADVVDAAAARFAAIAATFGPYLDFGEGCILAAAGSDTVGVGEGGGGDGTQQQADAGAADRTPCSFEAPLVLADPADGCGGALANANAARGAVVGVRRGGCTFATKVVRRANHICPAVAAADECRCGGDADAQRLSGQTRLLWLHG